MTEELALLFVIAVCFNVCGQVNVPGEYIAAKISTPLKNASLSDTLNRIKDTVIKKAEFVADPKQGFKDLFVSTSASGSLNTAQLNPRAVTFVQDYMDKNSKSLEKMKGQFFNFKSHFSFFLRKFDQERPQLQLFLTFSVTTPDPRHIFF